MVLDKICTTFFFAGTINHPQETMQATQMQTRSSGRRRQSASSSANAHASRRGRGRGNVGGPAEVQRSQVPMRRRTAEEEEAAKVEAARLEAHRLDGKYCRGLQLKLMRVVEDLMIHGRDDFLKSADDMRTGGWELAKQLDLQKIERNPTMFYNQFKKFLVNLKHKKLKKANNEPESQLHGTIKQYITAVNSCWRNVNAKVPELLETLCNKFMEAKRKDEKRKKAAGRIPDGRGRETMSFDLYRELAWYFLKRGNMFAHLFLILCWNTMVRNCNCDEIVFPNTIWVGDAFGVSVKKTKTNPDGSRDVQKDCKHIYANKFMPEVCPILAMALYFLANPFIGNSKSGNKQFFPGKNTHKTFNEDVTAALQDPVFTARLDSLGIPYKNVGAYSTRKGSTTYVCTGTTSGPPIISILLRAGWAIGKVLESYLRQSQAGDCFCGRVVCGLPVLHANFAALPPHFKLTEEDTEWQNIQSVIDLAYPFRESWGKSFQPTTVFMLASLVHHQSWLHDKLPVNHVVRSKANLWERLSSLHENLALDTEGRIQVTGVPPHSVMFGNIKKLDEDIERVERKVDDLSEAVVELPTKMIEGMKLFYHDREIENGVASASVVQEMIRTQNELIKQNTEMLSAKIASMSSAVRIMADTNTTDDTAPPATGVRRRGERGKWLWSHGAHERIKKYREQRFRFLPKDFRLSFDLKSKKRRRNPVDYENEDITRKKVTPYDAWQWWWDGLRWGDELIRPLKHMSKDPKMHFFIPNSRQRYHDLKCLVQGMVQLIENTGAVDSVSNSSAQEKRLLFKQGFQLMEKFINKHNPAYKTVNRQFPTTIAFTTLKREYYTAKVWHDREQKVLRFLEYLTEEDAEHFLKDTVSGQKLDLRRVNENPKDFFKVFSTFLMTITGGRRALTLYVKAVHMSLTNNGESALPFVYKNLITNFIH